MHLRETLRPSSSLEFSPPTRALHYSEPCGIFYNREDTPSKDPEQTSHPQIQYTGVPQLCHCYNSFHSRIHGLNQSFENMRSYVFYLTAAFITTVSATVYHPPANCEQSNPCDMASDAEYCCGGGYLYCQGGTHVVKCYSNAPGQGCAENACGYLECQFDSSDKNNCHPGGRRFI